MPKIKGYKPHPSIIWLDTEGYRENRRFGGWDTQKKALVPIDYPNLAVAENDPQRWALDSITLAVEAGTIDTDTFVEQAFATRADFEAFCNALRDFDWWLNDRHMFAFCSLVSDVSHVDTYAHLGESLARKYFARFLQERNATAS